MKIILGGFHQEVNTFAPGLSSDEHYARGGSCYGEEMLKSAETFGKQNGAKDALSAHFKVLKEIHQLMVLLHLEQIINIILFNFQH